jgi:hypothetical protein
MELLVSVLKQMFIYVWLSVLFGICVFERFWQKQLTDRLRMSYYFFVLLNYSLYLYVKCIIALIPYYALCI